MKKAFVTGATGFLGGHLCQLLIKRGWTVTALARSIPKKPIKGVNYVRGSLSDVQALLSAMVDDCDVVFHLASDTNTWRKYNRQQTKTNITGTQNIIRCAAERNVVTFLYVSSIVTYGVDHAGLMHIDESKQQHGSDSWVNYVRTKSLAEQLVKSAPDTLRTVIVNPTHIIGPKDEHNWIRLFKMIINDNLPTMPQGAGSFADVRDVAQGLLLAAEKGNNRENYILGGHNLSFPEFINTVCTEWQLKLTTKIRPHALIQIAAQIKSWFAYITGQTPEITPESLLMISHQYAVSSEKAQKQLGYTITPMTDTLAAIAVDLRERKIL